MCHFTRSNRIPFSLPLVFWCSPFPDWITCSGFTPRERQSTRYVLISLCYCVLIGILSLSVSFFCCCCELLVSRKVRSAAQFNSTLMRTNFETNPTNQEVAPPPEPTTAELVLDAVNPEHRLDWMIQVCFDSKTVYLVRRIFWWEAFDYCFL